MAQRPSLYLSFDMGGTQIRAAVITAEGAILGRDASLTPKKGGPSAALRAFHQVANKALEASGASLDEIEGIGVASAGPLDPATGTIFFIPNVPGWKDVPWRDMVEAELGRPTFLENDANAAALGEHAFGAGRGVSNLIYITVSTGIGGGLILGNRLYSGSSGTAGEIGHMTIEVDGPRCGCGNVGCWETLASGTALAREAVERIQGGARSSILQVAGGNISRVDARAIHEAATKGDALAQELIANVGHYLGVGLANLVNILNPQMLILGGGLTQMGDMLLGPARRTLELRAMAPALQGLRLELAQLGDNAGLMGAMVLARQQLER